MFLIFSTLCTIQSGFYIEDYRITMSEFSWDNIKADIERVNQPLFAILQTIAGIEDMFFSVFEYPYGQIIADENAFYLPNDGGSIASVPFCMVLEKNIEMFIEFRGKSIPHKVYKEGEFLGVSSLLSPPIRHHPSDILQICSGARNTFLLCPISDIKPHTAVERYFKTELSKPDDLSLHVGLFRQLCQAAQCVWRSKLLIFPTQLVSLIKENHLLALSRLIMEFFSNQSGYFANTPFYDYLMTYIRSNASNITSNEFINDVINQLIAIGVGQVPGYGLAVNEDLLPLELISHIYRDIYKSRYTPFVMVPTHFDKLSNNPVFFSILKQEMVFKPSSFSNKPQRCELIYNTYYQYAAQIRKLGYFKMTAFYPSATQLQLTIFNEKKVQGPPGLFHSPKEHLFDYDPRFLEVGERFGYLPSDFPSKTGFLIGCFGLKFND